jgi:probable HAF family extracellular repeat protein
MSLRHDQPRVDHSSQNLRTLPFWSDTFIYHSLQYTYTMVGANPRNGPSTTIIPTTLVPLRFAFADGSVYDATSDIVSGQTPVQGVINSPIFQNHQYIIGGTDVGNTQYGDAFQRANFWSDVSKGSRDYHVLLGTPAVTPVVTINVPTGLFGYQIDPDTSQVFPAVDITFLDNQVPSLIQNLNGSADGLTIFLTGRVSEFDAWGYHTSLYDGSSERTYIVASYLPSNTVYFGLHLPDAYVLSHEIDEWMDDPFPFTQPNFVPGWSFAGNTFPQGDSTAVGDLLEVADAFEFSDASVIPISMGVSTYHVTDAGFLSFFSRASISSSVNGQYSLFGSATQATPPCIGHIEINYSTFEFPGARSTLAYGINNLGQVTGTYSDAGNRTHGFFMDQGQITSLDFPGAISTFARKINDSGQIAGYYFDITGRPHGFVYKSGRFTTIDVPGAVDTIVTGINAGGDMVGGYDDANLFTHSFIVRNGSFLSFNSPFATQSQAQAINDHGVVVGLNWNIQVNPTTSFINDGNFAPFVIPGSITTNVYSVNNQNDLCGYFFNPGWTAGFVTLYGYTYQIYPRVFGNNDKNQIVGRVFNPRVGKFVGYVADLPSRNN